MNRALWSKAFADARWLCFWLAILLFGFQWIFVWATSLIELGALAIFLQSLPPAIEKLAGIPLAQVATTTGRIAMAYVDPVVLLAATCWGIARGSDVVSGEIGRGTMELLLAQPVRRVELLVSQAVVTTLGAALLAAAALCGTWCGVRFVTLDEAVEPLRFVPAALNLFALMIFLAGVSTLASSWDIYRWRTIGLVGGFYIVQLVIKVFARLVERLEGLLYVTFLGAFEPQQLVVSPDDAWQLSAWYDGTLVGLGVVAYVAAGVIFCKRDLPAPL